MNTLVIALLFFWAGCEQMGKKTATGLESEIKSSEIARTKLSIHTGFCVNVNKTSTACNNKQMLAYVQSVKPRVVKILDGFIEGASEIKAKSPGTLVIGRIYYPDQEFDFANDPVKEAERWWDLSKGKILAAGSRAVDFWEAVNEPRVSELYAMQQYAIFEKTRIKLMAAHRKAACIGNFSQGTPHINFAEGKTEFWQAFLPAIDEALAPANPRGILCLHEYSMTPHFQDSYYWHVGRYRQAYEYLRSVNRGHIQLALTEFGIDSNTSTGGWKAQYTQATVAAKAQAYVSELVWFDREYLQKDSFVLGATIYAHGIPGWENFDIEPILPILTRQVRL